MDIKYFDSQQSDEKVVSLIRRHFFAVLPAFLTATFVYICSFAAIILFPVLVPSLLEGVGYHFFTITISLVMLFNTVFLFNNWVLHYLHVAILTTEHFVEVEQSGLFSRKIAEMTLDKIQDVTASQKGIFNTLLNIGSVDVQTAGELPNFTLEFIPDPNGVSQKVMETEEVYSKRFGVRTSGTGPHPSSNNHLLEQQTAQPLQQTQSQPQGSPAQTEEQSPVIEYPGGQ